MKKIILLSILLIFLFNITFVLGQAGQDAEASTEITPEDVAPFIAAFGIIGLFYVFFIMFFVVIGILGTVFWIFMLIDCAKRDFQKDNEQVVWILIIALTGVIGGLIYYIMIKSKDKERRDMPAQ